MLAAIRQAQAQRQVLRHQVVLATEEFRSKSRFYVQPSPGGGWSVVSSEHNRLIGKNKTHLEAVTYAENLERMAEARPGSVFTAKAIGERATRWVSFLALLLVVFAVKVSK